MSVSIQQLKTDLIEHRKTQDKFCVKLLSTIIGECDRIDPKVLNVESVIQKMVKNNDIALCEIICEDAANVLIQENAFMSQYLPKKLSGPDLYQYILSCNIGENFHLGKTTGLILSQIKHDGRVADGREVRDILQSMIANNNDRL